MVYEKQRFKYLHLLKSKMGNVKVIDNDGAEKTLSVSTDVEAQVLAIQYLTKAIYKMGNKYG